MENKEAGRRHKLGCELGHKGCCTLRCPWDHPSILTMMEITHSYQSRQEARSLSGPSVTLSAAAAALP